MYLTAPKIEAATFIFFAGAIIGGAAQTTSSNAVDASHLEGKVLFGYQGFFRRPGQGNDHWMIKYGEVPGPSTPGDGKRNSQASLLPKFEATDVEISPIRHIPGCGAISRRMPLHHQLHSPRQLQSQALRIQLYRRGGHPFPMDAGEQH